MKLRQDKLPLMLGETYKKFFLLPFIIISFIVFYFNYEQPGIILVLGVTFCVIDLFFMRQAVWGKKAWLYSDVIVILECLFLSIIHFKALQEIALLG